MFQDLSRRLIETGFWRILEAAQIHEIRAPVVFICCFQETKLKPNFELPFVLYISANSIFCFATFFIFSWTSFILFQFCLSQFFTWFQNAVSLILHHRNFNFRFSPIGVSEVPFYYALP